MPRKKTVTLHTISERLGLSAHTVSKALRGLPGMSEETRKIVLDTARKLGYITKQQQISLAVDRIPVFHTKPFRFVFIQDSDSPMMITQQLRNGIRERMEDFGHLLETLTFSGTAIKELSAFAWAEKHGLFYADGIFLPPGLPFAFEQQLLELRLPKMMVNFPPPDAKVDSVIWDVTSAIYQSVHYYYSMGHRNIMYIGNIDQQRGFKQRWNAFNEAMQEHGLKPDPDMHMNHYVGSKEEWMRIFADKLATYKPTGFMCGLIGNLSLVFKVCGQLGKKIPDDYSLIALETIKKEIITDLSRPVLPVKETSERAVDRMLWRIGNPSVPYEHIRIQGEFHKGKTVRFI
ncbi:putative HTH-type transcriptional repressor ExuR [Paenibacillus solanacearum]|uniref:HTH-type transcriptional repressor ExuR n=1 Tax=Paenibacillus solanacearum TaxID=2048548 RepID=A0A916NH91_9BACL|nr:LacI family DNA-binding transcriptional regulator [Paenibacillus solanacearum]CAG7608158.1 putative HTH-type transcriptional repressor ExuR [Paenibacillus solanacearum]